MEDEVPDGPVLEGNVWKRGDRLLGAAWELRWAALLEGGLALFDRAGEPRPGVRPKRILTLDTHTTIEPMAPGAGPPSVRKRMAPTRARPRVERFTAGPRSRW